MKQHTVLYDGACAMCTFQMKVLSRLDWFGVFALVPATDPRARAVAPQLTSEDLQAAIHCVTAEGRVYQGARALRFMGLRLPLLVPLALALWIPGMIFLADIAYGWVSRNRQTLSRAFGCQDSCAIPPARKHPQDKAA
jgi:predicted DCC family thiol-disulfide oxidoreductase YuxK